MWSLAGLESALGVSLPVIVPYRVNMATVEYSRIIWILIGFNILAIQTFNCVNVSVISAFDIHQMGRSNH
jgi:hypothetical protein